MRVSGSASSQDIISRINSKISIIMIQMKSRELKMRFVLNQRENFVSTKFESR